MGLYTAPVEAHRDRPQWVVKVRTNMGFAPTHGARIVKVDRREDHTEYLMIVGEDDGDSAPTSDEE